MINRQFALILFAATLGISSATAQQLAPAPVDLTYRFHPGQKLHYHRVSETRDVEKPEGYENGNYDYTEDYQVTVEKIDPAGNATLKVKIDDSYNWHGGVDGSKVSGGRRASDIPLFSVTIDSRGNFMRGSILRRTPEDSATIEKMKNPSIQVWMKPDSSRIKFSIGNLFPPRPVMTSTLPGSHQHDSTTEPSRMQPTHLGGPTPTGTKAPPEPPAGYDATTNDFSIVQGAKERGDSEYRLITKSTHYQAFGGGIFSAKTDEDQHIRTSDGQSTHRTSITHRVDNGKPEPGYSKISVKLISE